VNLFIVRETHLIGREIEQCHLHVF